MPELTAIHIVLLAVLAIIGAVAGWFARDRRAVREKDTVKAMWQQEINRHRKEQRRLARQSKALMEQISQQQAHHSNLKKQLAELSTNLGDAGVRNEELQREIESRDTQVDTLSNELKSWQTRLPPLIDRYRIRNEEAERLETSLEAARATIRELEAEAQRDEAAARATIRKLEAQRDEAAARAIPAEPLHNAAPLADGLEASNDENDEYLEEADAEVTPAAVDAASATRSATSPDSEAVAGEEAPEDPVEERDNLKKIKGVGPAIEKTLNEMGIFSFRQLAEMSDYDIDRVARRLKGFHSRIHREDWIGQARTLLDEAASA